MNMFTFAEPLQPKHYYLKGIVTSINKHPRTHERTDTQTLTGTHPHTHNLA
jgi:hypothetical protein